MDASKIQSKYQESFQFLQAKKRRQAAQLALLNNLRRGDQFIASTLLLTLFNRIMATLYDNKIQVKFLPSQGITQDQINAYNILAQSDYQEMDKAKLDYDWTWDTLFFGRGYMETLRFDKKRKIMQPHVINPLVLGYDPYNANPQDWRYYWKWITKNKWEIEALIKSGVITGITSSRDLPGGIEQALWQYKVKVDQARDGIAPPSEPSDHDVFQLLEFFTINDEGKKCVYWLDKNLSKVLFEQELDLKDGEEIIAPDGSVIETSSKWPIVVKETFREPHSSIPFSVADLLEDKHRAKSVLLNLTYIAAKDQANPLYGYNPDKVRDVTQFFNRQINQHIPMEDEKSAWPLQKASAMTGDLLQFIRMMESEAEQPMGAGRPMQPEGTGGKQTATTAALDQQLNDLAQSLQSKVLQFGEQEFWSHWFHRYANNTALGEKMANIVGVKGVDSKIIDLKLFNTDFPPGVMVYSAKEAEYKDLVKRRDYMQLYPAFAQTMDADGLRNFQKHVFFPLFLEDPSLIDVMFPKTIDEMTAESENGRLQEGIMVDVEDSDNHSEHIYTHMMSQPKTWETWFHIDWHQKLLSEQKKQQMLAVQQQGIGTMDNNAQQPQQSQQSAVSQPQVGAQKKSPLANASPLKTEINPNNSIK